MNSTSTIPAIQVKNVSFAYKGTPVFSDLSFTIGQGDFVAIIGPNGGGKTTLLKLLLGLLEQEDGSVAIFGHSPEESTSNVGYVPQYSTLQSAFPATLLETVLMGAARPSFFGGMWPTAKKNREKALELLAGMQLADLAGKSINALSGGQRQRALIARALMGRSDLQKPFLLLMDEPTASIDPAGKFCFYEFLGKLRDEITIVIVSHEMLLTSPYFSKILFINHAVSEMPNNTLTPEILAKIFGEHQHGCPVGDLQHAQGALHPQGCTHEHCATQTFAQETCLPMARKN